MKSIRTILILALLALVGCSSSVKEISLVGYYGVEHPPYSPMWLHLLADGTFVLKTGYDTPVDIGGGKLGFVKEERGRWTLARSGFAIATADSTENPSPKYFLTLMKDTPRGSGIFVSTDRNAAPDWRSIERFLVPKGPNQSPEPTAAAGRGSS